MKDLGEKPWHFVQDLEELVVGPGVSVPLPTFSQAIDWESSSRP